MKTGIIAKYKCSHFQAVWSSHADAVQALLDVFLGMVILKPLFQTVHDKLTQDASWADHFLSNLGHEVASNQLCNTLFFIAGP